MPLLLSCKQCAQCRQSGKSLPLVKKSVGGGELALGCAADPGESREATSVSLQEQNEGAYKESEGLSAMNGVPAQPQASRTGFTQDLASVFVDSGTYSKLEPLPAQSRQLCSPEEIRHRIAEDAVAVEHERRMRRRRRQYSETLRISKSVRLLFRAFEEVERENLQILETLSRGLACPNRGPLHPERKTEGETLADTGAEMSGNWRQDSKKKPLPRVLGFKTSAPSPGSQSPRPHGAAPFKEVSASTTASDSSSNPSCAFSPLAPSSLSVPQTNTRCPLPFSSRSSVRPYAAPGNAKQGLGGKPSVPAHLSHPGDAQEGREEARNRTPSRDSEKSRSSVSSFSSPSSSSGSSASSRASSSSPSASPHSRERSGEERQKDASSFAAQARRIQKLLALPHNEQDMYSRFNEGYFPSLPDKADPRRRTLRPRSRGQQGGPSSGKRPRARRPPVGETQSGSYSGAKVGVSRCEAEKRSKTTYRLDKSHNSAGPYISKYSNIDRLHLGRSRQQATMKKQLGARTKRGETQGTAYELRSAGQGASDSVLDDPSHQAVSCGDDKEDENEGQQDAQRSAGGPCCGLRVVETKGDVSGERRKAEPREAKGKGGKVRRHWSAWGDKERVEELNQDIVEVESSTDEGDDDDETDQMTTSRENGLHGKVKAKNCSKKISSETVPEENGEMQPGVASRYHIGPSAVREDGQEVQVNGRTEKKEEEVEEDDKEEASQRKRRLLSTDEERRSSGKALWVSKRLQELQEEQEDEEKESDKAESEDSLSAGQEDSDEWVPQGGSISEAGGGKRKTAQSPEGLDGASAPSDSRKNSDLFGEENTRNKAPERSRVAETKKKMREKEVLEKERRTQEMYDRQQLLRLLTAEAKTLRPWKAGITWSKTQGRWLVKSPSWRSRWTPPRTFAPQTVDEVAATLAAACEYLDKRSGGSHRTSSTPPFSSHSGGGSQLNSASTGPEVVESGQRRISENGPDRDSWGTFACRSSVNDNTFHQLAEPGPAVSLSAATGSGFLTTDNTEERAQCLPGLRNEDNSTPGFDSLKMASSADSATGKKKQDKAHHEDSQAIMHAEGGEPVGEIINSARQSQERMHSSPTDGKEEEEGEKKEKRDSLSPSPRPFAASKVFMRRKRRRYVEEDEEEEEGSQAGGRAQLGEEGADEKQETKELPPSKVARQNSLSQVHGEAEGEERVYTSSQLDRIADKMRPLKYPMMYWLKGQRAFTVKVFKFEKVFFPPSPPAGAPDATPSTQGDAQQRSEDKQSAVRKDNSSPSVLAPSSLETADESPPPLVALRNKRYIGCKRFALAQNTLKCFYEAYEGACACAAELGYPLATSLVRLASGGAAQGKGGGKLGGLGGDGALCAAAKKTQPLKNSSASGEEDATTGTTPPPSMKSEPDRGEAEGNIEREESEGGEPGADGGQRAREASEHGTFERVLRSRRKTARAEDGTSLKGEEGESGEEREHATEKRENLPGDGSSQEKHESRRSQESQPGQAGEQRLSAEEPQRRDRQGGADGIQVDNSGGTDGETGIFDPDVSQEDGHPRLCREGADKTEPEDGGATETDDEDFLLIDLCKKRRKDQRKDRPVATKKRRLPSVRPRPGRSRSTQKDAASLESEEGTDILYTASERSKQKSVPGGPEESTLGGELATQGSIPSVETSSVEGETPQESKGRIGALGLEDKRGDGRTHGAFHSTHGCCESEADHENARETGEDPLERAQTEVSRKRSEIWEDRAEDVETVRRSSSQKANARKSTEHLPLVPVLVSEKCHQLEEDSATREGRLTCLGFPMPASEGTPRLSSDQQIQSLDVVRTGREVYPRQSPSQEHQGEEAYGDIHRRPTTIEIECGGGTDTARDSQEACSQRTETENEGTLGVRGITTMSSADTRENLARMERGREQRDVEKRKEAGNRESDRKSDGRERATKEILPGPPGAIGRDAGHECWKKDEEPREAPIKERAKTLPHGMEQEEHNKKEVDGAALGEARHCHHMRISRCSKSRCDPLSAARDSHSESSAVLSTTIPQPSPAETASGSDLPERVPTLRRESVSVLSTQPSSPSSGFFSFPASKSLSLCSSSRPYVSVASPSLPSVGGCTSVTSRSPSPTHSPPGLLSSDSCLSGSSPILCSPPTLAREQGKGIKTPEPLPAVTARSFLPFACSPPLSGCTADRATRDTLGKAEAGKDEGAPACFSKPDANRRGGVLRAESQSKVGDSVKGQADPAEGAEREGRPCTNKGSDRQVDKAKAGDTFRLIDYQTRNGESVSKSSRCSDTHLVPVTSRQSSCLSAEEDAGGGKDQTVSIERWLAAKVRQQMESQRRPLAQTPAGVHEFTQDSFSLHSTVASLATSEEPSNELTQHISSPAGGRDETVLGNKDHHRSRDRHGEVGEAKRERDRQEGHSGGRDTMTGGTDCHSAVSSADQSSFSDVARLPREGGHPSEARTRFEGFRPEGDKYRLGLSSDRQEYYSVPRRRKREYCAREPQSASPSDTPRQGVTSTVREERRNGWHGEAEGKHRHGNRSTQGPTSEAGQQGFDFMDEGAPRRDPHSDGRWHGNQDGEARKEENPKGSPVCPTGEWLSSGGRLSRDTHAGSSGGTLVSSRQIPGESRSRSEERGTGKVGANARLRSARSDSSRSPSREGRRFGKDKYGTRHEKRYRAVDRNTVCADERRAGGTHHRCHTSRETSSSRSRERSSSREHAEDHITDLSFFRYSRTERLGESGRRERSRRADCFLDGDPYCSGQLPSARHELASGSRRRRRSSPEELVDAQNHTQRPERAGCKSLHGDSAGWERKRGGYELGDSPEGERNSLLRTSREKMPDSKRHWEHGKERRRSRSICRQRMPHRHHFFPEATLPYREPYNHRRSRTVSRSEGQSPTGELPSSSGGWRPFLEANRHRHFALRRGPDTTKALGQATQESQPGGNAGLGPSEAASRPESDGPKRSPGSSVGDGKTSVPGGQGEPRANGPRGSDPGNLFTVFQMGTSVPPPQPGTRKQKIKVSIVTKKPDKSDTGV